MEIIRILQTAISAPFNIQNEMTNQLLGAFVASDVLTKGFVLSYSFAEASKPYSVQLC